MFSAERRESAVVGGAELLDRNVLGRFEYTVPYFLRGLDARSDRSDYSDEDPLIRLQVFAYDFQDMPAIPLTRKRDVEISRLQRKQAGQQLCIVDIGAVRRIEIISRAGVDTDAPALLRREPRQREVVQVDEAVEKISRRIDLRGQPSFGEIDLNLVRTLFQAAPYLGFMLVQQIVDELLARIIQNRFGWVQQTQGRRRNHRLLDRHVSVAHGGIQVAVCVPPVTERTTREPRQAARMAIRERDLETVRGHVRKPMDAVRREIVMLPLFAVRNDRRAGGFEPFDGVSNRIFIE